MRENAWISVIIPALDEERSIGQVLDAIPSWVDEAIVVDNGSTDRTAARATEYGARVLSEPRRGYGVACLTAIAGLDPRTDVVVFLDGDFSDHPEEMDRLVDPIVAQAADMVIGSRVLGQREPGALTPQARFGNWLSCALMHLIWRHRYTDLGPFRAIEHQALQRLDMRDLDYGWTVEMQLKALRHGLRVRDVPVSYRRRAMGQSKVSGTLRGVFGAGTKILWTIFTHAWD
jgi:glycosyltransferase involved in cell wall biosynthesis